MATVIGAGRVVATFRECFGADPGGVWHAPGRANLIGEHTDYNEGFVLPFALDRGTLAAAGLTGGAALELRDAAMPGATGPGAAGPGARVTVPLDTLVPGEVAGWAAYPAGAAWALREAGYPVTGTSLAIDPDLPQGAGLSASAALRTTSSACHPGSWISPPPCSAGPARPCCSTAAAGKAPLCRSTQQPPAWPC